MALANVAFIAAMNRQRVLVMDWDLEAPGLGYYFRGLMEPQDARALKRARGILDAAWDWVATVRQTGDKKERNDFIGRYLNGYVFDEMVQPLLDNEMQMEGYTLDIFGAGSDQIGGKLAYEEALSLFSWTTFLNADAGGIMLDALRNWAKERYDIILVDSRTGLADVSGVCTMQLPDTVALCFILNRQNMEGVARVAGAIRAKREEEIKLRVVPMRLAARGTSEEADAQARARRELTMYGGFSGDAVDDDMRSLRIESSPNVPFYEAIAPIMAMDPMTDTLSQNYLQLAAGLFQLDFVMPDLSDQWADRVRSRLKPSHANPDYLLQLQSAIPERAFGEISHLVEVALDAQLEHDADLEDDYVDALVRTTFVIGDIADSPFDASLLLSQAANLVRARMIEAGESWRALLVETLTKLLEYNGYLDDSEELALLDELDALLINDPTIAVRLTRLRYRRAAARLHITNKDAEAAFQTIAEIVQIIATLQHNELASDQMLLIQTAEADTFLLRGDGYLVSEGNPAAAARAILEFRRGHALPAVRERHELQRFRFEFSVRLAIRFPEQMDAEERALFALDAAKAGSGQSYGSVYFTELAQPLLQAWIERGPRLQRYVEATLGHDRLSTFANYHGRQPRVAARFLDTAAQIVESLAVERPHGWENSVRDIGKTSAQVARLVMRRRATLSSRGQDQPLAHALARLVRALQIGGVGEGAAELNESLLAIDRRIRHEHIGPEDDGNDLQ